MLIVPPSCWAIGSVETAGPLVDVILPRDQTWLEQVLLGGEPYDSLETAYYVAVGAAALGNTAATKMVGEINWYNPASQMPCT